MTQCKTFHIDLLGLSSSLWVVGVQQWEAWGLNLLAQFLNRNFWKIYIAHFSIDESTKVVKAKC